MAIVTPTDRPKYVRHRCVIKVCGGVIVLSCCFFFFVSAGAVIGLSQIKLVKRASSSLSLCDKLGVNIMYNFITTIKTMSRRNGCKQRGLPHISHE